MNTTNEINDNDISTLCTEAAQAGDYEMEALGERALAGDAEARAECERVIRNARLPDSPRHTQRAGRTEKLRESQLKNSHKTQRKDANGMRNQK